MSEIPNHIPELGIRYDNTIPYEGDNFDGKTGEPLNPNIIRARQELVERKDTGEAEIVKKFTTLTNQSFSSPEAAVDQFAELYQLIDAHNREYYTEPGFGFDLPEQRLSQIGKDFPVTIGEEKYLVGLHRNPFYGLSLGVIDSELKHSNPLTKLVVEKLRSQTK